LRATDSTKRRPNRKCPLQFLLPLFTLAVTKRFDTRYDSFYRSKKSHCISPAQGSFGLPRTTFFASNRNIRNMASARPEDEIGALADCCLQVTPCAYYQWHSGFWRDVVLLPAEPSCLCRTVTLSSLCRQRCGRAYSSIGTKCVWLFAASLCVIVALLCQF